MVDNGRVVVIYHDTRIYSKDPTPKSVENKRVLENNSVSKVILDENINFYDYNKYNAYLTRFQSWLNKYYRDGNTSKINV